MNAANSDGPGSAREVPRILLFLKAPRPGRVKTRLAATVGGERAVEIYRTLVERQLAALPAGWQVEIRFDPEDAGPEMAEWLGEGFTYRPQVPGDLGDRMIQALRTAFSEGDAPVFCVGADCPELVSGDFEEARGQLENGADLVFGPATDGGYYLLGLSRFCPEVFEKIPWRSPETLKQSLSRSAEHGRRVGLLEEKSDVDEWADWEPFENRDFAAARGRAR